MSKIKLVAVGTLRERFYAKVEVTENGCHVWRAALTSAGYGLILMGGRLKLAHRVAYEMNVGPIPDGLVIDHLCRNRACVNPEHLEPVTQGDNIRRGKGNRVDRTHCPQGHPYSGDNLYFDRKGHRFCRQCSRGRATARYHKLNPDARYFKPTSVVPDVKLR